MRSSCYDELLAAETRASKNLKGMYSKREVPVHRVSDISQVRIVFGINIVVFVVCFCWFFLFFFFFSLCVWVGGGNSRTNGLVQL